MLSLSNDKNNKFAHYCLFEDIMFEHLDFTNLELDYINYDNASLFSVSNSITTIQILHQALSCQQRHLLRILKTINAIEHNPCQTDKEVDELWQDIAAIYNIEISTKIYSSRILNLSSTNLIFHLGTDNNDVVMFKCINPLYSLHKLFLQTNDYMQLYSLLNEKSVLLNEQIIELEHYLEAIDHNLHKDENIDFVPSETVNRINTDLKDMDHIPTNVVSIFDNRLND